MSTVQNETPGIRETKRGRTGRLRIAGLAALGAVALLLGACTEYHHSRPQYYYAPGYYYSSPYQHHHHHRGHDRYNDHRRGWR